MEINHSESYQYWDMYFRQPQQILVFGHLAYRQETGAVRKLIFFQKVLIHQRKVTINNTKELCLQI
jgi:hypothetical protein